MIAPSINREFIVAVQISLLRRKPNCLRHWAPGTERTRHQKASVFQTPHFLPGASERRLSFLAGCFQHPDDRAATEKGRQQGIPPINSPTTDFSLITHLTLTF